MDCLLEMSWYPGAHFNMQTVFPCVEISLIKIKRSWDCVMFIMEVPTLVRWHLYIETAPRLLGKVMCSAPIVCGVPDWFFMSFISINSFLFLTSWTWNVRQKQIKSCLCLFLHKLNNGKWFDCLRIIHGKYHQQQLRQLIHCDVDCWAT